MSVTSATRPDPAPDEISAPYWEGVAQSELRIQRCRACGKYQFPPVACCFHCLSTELYFDRVSGEGVVQNYSCTVSGARHPYFAALTPYLVGLVELAEQPGLLLTSNFPETKLEEISVGAPVTAYFDEVAGAHALTQFRLTESL